MRSSTLVVDGRKQSACHASGDVDMSCRTRGAYVEPARFMAAVAKEHERIGDGKCGPNDCWKSSMVQVGEAGAARCFIGVCNVGCTSKPPAVCRAKVAPRRRDCTLSRSSTLLAQMAAVHICSGCARCPEASCHDTAITGGLACGEGCTRVATRALVAADLCGDAIGGRMLGRCGGRASPVRLRHIARH